MFRRLIALFATLIAVPVFAADVQVAVAANFTEPAREIAAAYDRASGNHTVLSFGSSGAFYTQMQHGAPFEVFLSADAERPEKAEAEGLGVKGTRFTYAIGKLVLYSAKPATVDGRGVVLKRGIFDKLAIADPAAAPYGLAAVQTIAKLGLTDALAPKIVKGGSITQAYQFVATGAADLGFVALSQVIDVKEGSRWIVPERYHAPIDQQAILLKTGLGNPAATGFLKFLRSPPAIAIIKRYGYAVK
jgi:molybdate transport system substrate-binding protein